MDAPAAELDEEEHVQPLQRDRLDGEEVDCEHALRLCAQERSPGESASRAGRAEARLMEDLLYRRGGDGDAEAVQLAGDPLVAPARILAREAKHQLADLPADRRPAAPTVVGPTAVDESSVPAQQRRRRNHERPPARSRQQPTRSSQKDTIGLRQLRTICLPTKYRQLMPQHDDL
jgi:hypothetical protein